AAFDRALVVGLGGGAPATGARLLFDRRPVLTEALGVALRAGAIARAALYAQPLLDGGEPPADAWAALALFLLEAGRSDEAQSLVERAPADSIEVRLALAAIAARRGQMAAAAASLRRAAQLDPQDPRPRQRLAELYRVEREAVPRDLYALLTLAHRHFARTPELAELSPEAGRPVGTPRPPPPRTGVGGFHSGKSSFVNARVADGGGA